MKYDCEKIEHFDVIQPGEFVYDPYDIEACDILPARYHLGHMGLTIRDIACLPMPLGWKQLREANARFPEYYDEEKIQYMEKDERLKELLVFPDRVRLAMPFHLKLERAVNEALISAYSQRQIGYLETTDEQGNVIKEYQSKGPAIGSSVKNVSVLGTAGSGKSTSVQMLLSRYPKALKHTFSDGSQYIQIPIIAFTAYEGKDIKNMMVKLAEYIDTILDNDNWHSEKMSKLGNVAKMQNYLIRLIRQYHIGMIIIDEIQLMVSGSVFSHLLSITADASVSICVIGTEDAFNKKDKDLWLKRRFMQLGCIITDMKETDDALFTEIIKCIWRYQWTKEKTLLTEAIIAELKKASAYNICYLLTLYVTMQLIAIGNRGDETKMTPSMVREAAARFPGSTELIQKGQKMEADIVSEQKNFLTTALKELEEKEQKAMVVMNQNYEEAVFRKEAAIREAIKRVTALMDVEADAVKKAFRTLSGRDPAFETYDDRQRAMMIYHELLDKNNTTKEKTRTKQTGKKNRKDHEMIAGLEKGLMENMSPAR